ncbi:hypothetical protein J6590_064037 [Homalodisca vitripennis]|nr:hypothetical protein J6590_064037 [Homalodisca vitripennis]
MCPGLTRTEQADSFKEGKDDAALSPADVADAVVYALSTPALSPADVADAVVYALSTPSTVIVCLLLYTVGGRVEALSPADVADAVVYALSTPLVIASKCRVIHENMQKLRELILHVKKVDI